MSCCAVRLLTKLTFPRAKRGGRGYITAITAAPNPNGGITGAKARVTLLADSQNGQRKDQNFQKLAARQQGSTHTRASLAARQARRPVAHHLSTIMYAPGSVPGPPLAVPRPGLEDQLTIHRQTKEISAQSLGRAREKCSFMSQKLVHNSRAVVECIIFTAHAELRKNR